MLVSRHTNSLQGGPTHISGSLARSASALSCIGGLQNSLQGSSAQISGSLARSARAIRGNGGTSDANAPRGNGLTHKQHFFITFFTLSCRYSCLRKNNMASSSVIEALQNFSGCGERSVAKPRESLFCDACRTQLPSQTSFLCRWGSFTNNTKQSRVNAR